MSTFIFVIYSSKDKSFWKALETTLALHRTNGKVQLWDPHNDISLGLEIQQEIDEHLKRAQIILLLLSPDFFVDEDCLQQMQQAFTRQKETKGAVSIIPILLRPCLWQGEGLERLPILPREKMPVTKWPDRDEVLLNIAQEVHIIIRNSGEASTKEKSSAAIPVSPQSQQANKYNIQANIIHAGAIGDNSGTITVNHSNPISETHSSPTPAKPDQVDVGIIIALKEEFSVLFAEIMRSSQAIRDLQTNEIYYSFARNSTVAGRPYRCIAAFIGGMGPTLAALQAEKMIARWNPTTLVLPGIAASLSSSARLGDIVVADQVDGYMENAKAASKVSEQGYNLVFSGEVYRTSGTLLKEAQNFEFSTPDIFRVWQAGASTMLHNVLSEELRNTLVSKKLLREQAQIIEGHIASGSIVGAAQAFTQWLKDRDRKYLALEMEAMGVMAAVYKQASTKNINTLILRAISDYGDEEKSKLDNVGEGVLRSYAMQNAVQLLWSFLDAGLLSQPS